MKPRPYILAESHYKDLQHASIDLAILPWGATEAHNYHLPYGTDIIESDSLAAESARLAWEAGAKVMVLPTIPYGVNTGQDDIFLDMNLNPSTQYAILNDILDVLDRQGVSKLLIFNSHGGNDFKPMIRELGLAYPDVFISTCNWYQSVEKLDYFEEDGDHADEMETSLMLHLKPELILAMNEAGDGKEKKSKISALNEDWAWAERKWSMVSEDTGIGNPKKATREKGERYFRAVTEKVAQLMIDLSRCDPKDLYE